MNRLVPTPAVPSMSSVADSPAADERMTVASFANASSRPTKRALVYLAGIAGIVHAGEGSSSTLDRTPLPRRTISG